MCKFCNIISKFKSSQYSFYLFLSAVFNFEFVDLQGVNFKIK
jgi:hypothetical protein